MAKPKRRKATLHSTGKVREADLLERAQALADDPTLAMPHCEGGCVWFSPVAAARKAILRIHADRDDEAALQKHARRGNELARAYAATLLLAKSGKVPFVAELKFAGQSVPYVIRGAAKPFYVAGLQNHHDRALRILSVFPMAKKRGLHFFSADRGIVCTGRAPRPPADFVEEEMAELSLVLREPGVYACEHGGAAGGLDTLVLGWRAAGVRLERCVECLDDESTLGALLKHMAGPKVVAQFEPSARLAPLRVAAGVPLDADEVALPAGVREDYLRARSTDKQLLEAARLARTASLRARGEALHVAGDASYGTDRKAFLDALHPTEAERAALEAALSRLEGPLVLERASSARAIAELWPGHGRLMLEAVSDADTAARLHREKVTPEEAADLVRRASREGRSKVALSQLPAYGPLPPAAALADALARAHRAQGREAAVRLAVEQAGAGRAKGVALAFLDAMEARKGQEWRFSPVDQDVALSVQAQVRDLLEGPASSYHESLRALSRGAGETTPFEPVR